ncbi:MAG: GTPase [Solibacillus sp.]|uniref:GTPase n=1 Tax=unclassified Solibacillus TaxID=2637870 RepID=UPI0030F4BAC5
MNIELKNDLLNLPSLQQQVDTIVFDYIDTKPNWSKAFEQLDELLQKMAVTFNNYVERNEGELPKSSTYWVLFMDIASKLLYFTGLAHSNLINEKDEEAKAHIVNMYKLSAVCLPNPIREENEEVLSEIQKSIAYISAQEPVAELSTACSTDECIRKFETFAKSYK